jgi:hypothetical protein
MMGRIVNNVFLKIRKENIMTFETLHDHSLMLQYDNKTNRCI